MKSKRDLTSFVKTSRLTRKNKYAKALRQDPAYRQRVEASIKQRKETILTHELQQEIKEYL